MNEDKRIYKGRVVFRGDQVKDEIGHYAVFTEQGASASHLTSANLLDAIARMPGCAGGDSDAVGAYTQVALDDIAYLGLDPKSIVDTWISLPLDQRPASWAKYKDPVCKLRLNLEGHPLAGLICDKFCQKQVMSECFEKVSGWECLYIHKKQQLLLSCMSTILKWPEIKTIWTKCGRL